MPAPSTATIFTRERAAADLAEKTGILLVRRIPSQPIELHLASLDPGHTACRQFTHADWVGVHPRLAPQADRVCWVCCREWRTTPEAVVASFFEWRNAPR
jgi:hypothetical protein